MGTTAGAGRGGSPEAQPPRDSRQRGVRAFALVALIVCVALVGIGSLIATASAGGLASLVALANSSHTTTKSGQSNNSQNNPSAVGDAHDIIPTAGFQTTSVTTNTRIQISGVGKEIFVSVAKQHLWAYQDGQAQFDFDVATGRPGLPSPIGSWKVLYKRADTTFYSPWPQGSNLYYYPTHIHYALNFHDGGFYIHDSWWRCTYGPGSNVPHHVNCMDEGDPPNRGPAPVDGTETGSHGCVGMPLSVAEKLYDWAPVGTPVYVSPN